MWTPPKHKGLRLTGNSTNARLNHPHHGNNALQMNPNQKLQLLEKIRSEVAQRYVFPDVGYRVSCELAQLWSHGHFPHDDGAHQFAEKVTAELRRLCDDSHIRVRYAKEAHIEAAAEEVVREQNDRRAHCEEMAFGIERVERLPSNIGYVDIREFVELSLAAPAVSAAMTLVAKTKALILDLRNCVGGDPITVAWLASYLFDRRTQLSTFMLRDESKSEQFWTSEGVPGPKFGGAKPVYVLTANFTFSGAEQLAYDLQGCRRAKIVGEVTGGGAHACNLYWLDPHFNLLLPECRPVNPVTGSNWEKVGVKPDVLTTQAAAFDEAVRLARATVDDKC